MNFLLTENYKFTTQMLAPVSTRPTSRKTNKDGGLRFIRKSKLCTPTTGGFVLSQVYESVGSKYL